MADEIGYQLENILPGWGSIAEEAHEKNPALRWPESIEVNDQMRREDSQVGSVLRAVMLPIRRTNWALDPTGVRDEVVMQVSEDLGLPVKGREYVAPLRTRDRFAWGEHLRLALLMLVFGHSVFEQVYRIDAFGRARLRKLAWRPPRTIADFKVARDGGLIGIEQHSAGGAGGKIEIPVDRLVVYVNEREGANWLGTSLLRSAYKNWLLKDRMLRAQALTVERNGLGIPTYIGAPDPAGEGVTTEKIQEHRDAEIKSGLNIAKNTRAGEKSGVSAPHGAQFALTGVTGKLPDADAPIRYHDEQIARAVLAHFLNLGTETGSWALGSTFANFFTDSLNAVSQEIAAVAQQHIVEDLVDLNWGEQEPAPRIVPAAIGSEHPATADAVKVLVDAGIIKPDEKLEDFMRSQYSLPARPADATALEDPAPGKPPAPGSTTGDVAETPDATDAERARFAAETAQKVYLAVPDVLDKDEARALVRRAGAELGESSSQSAEEGA